MALDQIINIWVARNTTVCRCRYKSVYSVMFNIAVNDCIYLVKHGFTMKKIKAIAVSFYIVFFFSITFPSVQLSPLVRV